jgi:hypothetical protein
VLRAKERTPTLHSFIVFTLDSHLSLLRSLGVRQLLWESQKICVHSTYGSRCVALCDFLVYKKHFFISDPFSLFYHFRILFQVSIVFVWTFTGDVVHGGQFVFPNFSLFPTLIKECASFEIFLVEPLHDNRPKSLAPLVGCALVRRTTHTTYVKRQDFIKHMSDMLDFTMY